jgi:RNA polymerase sigma-70 factor (ECF subfamily)
VPAVTDHLPVDPDRTLVAEAAAGSREAFDELVRRHQARIFNLARALVGEDAEAEDLAQDTFVRAWRAIRRFRGESTFRTWLYRVAINVIRGHLAARARKRIVWGWWRHDTFGERTIPLEAVDPADMEADAMRREFIDRALAALPVDQRVAVTLRDIEGLDYREIAVALGVPIGTVMSRISRARARLRPLLAPLMAGRAFGAGHHD